MAYFKDDKRFSFRWKLQPEALSNKRSVSDKCGTRLSKLQGRNSLTTSDARISPIHKIPQNHGIIKVGKDLQKSSDPIYGLKQGNL